MLCNALSEFAAYLRAPRLIAPAPLRDGGWRRLGLMTLVYCGGLVVLGVLAAAWKATMHLPAPEAFGKIPPIALVSLAVLVFPVIEETLFRGPLTGRPRALWLLAMAVLAGALMAATVLQWHDQIAALGVLATGIAAPVGWFVLRRRAVPAWYARHFGWWFFGSALVFGLAHLGNYPGVSLALIPLVLPQVWAGLVFGYLRMRHGIGAAIMAHCAGNAATLAAALLGG